MICFMFPGQPLSRAALPDDAEFEQMAELVRRVAHLDLESFQWLDGEGSEELKLQMLGVAQSLYRLRLLRSQGVRPDLVAPHSMGIYPALVACGSISETEAVEITWRVGSSFARMAGRQQYALGCVIGLALEPVLAIAGKNEVHLANHNSSRHFLLSGAREKIDLAVTEALESGAFSARSFNCDAPLHTPLMAQLEPELLEIFGDYRYAEPACPLLDHLNQNYLSCSDIPGFMLGELSLPVYWEKSYRKLRAAGVKEFHEVGAGEALKKFNRWIEAECES
ncbi:MAG: malonyl CoA-ACP transacylase [Geobacteraceae bacterium GWC2_58_44]|nr:MAG: malonyl CoA-ACP transacylase [Geobacteraceae bacterium GWC2_58_44]HBG05069.1 ACP S-malonyltransferase [Geobacter sp.]